MNTALKHFIFHISYFIFILSLSAMSGGRPAPGHKFRASGKPVYGKISEQTSKRPVGKVQPIQGSRKKDLGSSGFFRTVNQRTVTASHPRELSENRRPAQTVPVPEPVKESEKRTGTQPVRKASEFRPGHRRTVQKRERRQEESVSNTDASVQEQKTQPVSSDQGRRIVEKKSRTGR